MDKPENPETPSAFSNITSFVSKFVLITALESFGLSLIWKHILVVTFGIPMLKFGYIFILLLALKYLVRDILFVPDVYDSLEASRLELVQTNEMLREELDIQVFSEQNRTFQFNSHMAILSELVKEREAKNNPKNEQGG